MAGQIWLRELAQSPRPDQIKAAFAFGGVILPKDSVTRAGGSAGKSVSDFAFMPLDHRPDLLNGALADGVGEAYEGFDPAGTNGLTA